MKKIIYLIIGTLVFLFGFIIAIGAFRSGWNRFDYRHLEWDISFEGCEGNHYILEDCVRDCLFYMKPVEDGAIMIEIFCIKTR